MVLFKLEGIIALRNGNCQSRLYGDQCVQDCPIAIHELLQIGVISYFGNLEGLTSGLGLAPKAK